MVQHSNSNNVLVEPQITHWIDTNEEGDLILRIIYTSSGKKVTFFLMAEDKKLAQLRNLLNERLWEFDNSEAIKAAEAEALGALYADEVTIAAMVAEHEAKKKAAREAARAKVLSERSTKLSDERAAEILNGINGLIHKEEE